MKTTYIYGKDGKAQLVRVTGVSESQEAKIWRTQYPIAALLVAEYNREQQEYITGGGMAEDAQEMERCAAEHGASGDKFQYKGSVPERLYKFMIGQRPDGTTDAIRNKDYLKWASTQPETAWLKKYPLLLEAR